MSQRHECRLLNNTFMVKFNNELLFSIALLLFRQNEKRSFARKPFCISDDTSLYQRNTGDIHVAIAVPIVVNILKLVALIFNHL